MVGRRLGRLGRMGLAFKKLLGVGSLPRLGLGLSRLRVRIRVLTDDGLGKR